VPPWVKRATRDGNARAGGKKEAPDTRKKKGERRMKLDPARERSKDGESNKLQR